MKKTKAQIKRELKKLRGELNAIEETELKKVHYPRLEKLLGTSWVYRDNDYGGDTPKWDVFKRVIETFYDKEGTLFYITEEFSVDCYGKCSWEIERHFPYPPYKNPFNSCYEQISSEEYERERAAFFQEASQHQKAKETT